MQMHRSDVKNGKTGWMAYLIYFFLIVTHVGRKFALLGCRSILAYSTSMIIEEEDNWNVPIDIDV